MIKELNFEEIEQINGGHDGSAYRAGVLVGDILEVAITAFGAGRLLRFFK